LSLPDGDAGFAVIKPSGSDQTVAIVSGDRILMKPKEGDARVYDYRLGRDSEARLVKDAPERAELQKRLEAFIQTATQSLLENSIGADRGNGVED
jgi:hypothetical protein